VAIPVFKWQPDFDEDIIVYVRVREVDIDVTDIQSRNTGGKKDWKRRYSDI
jgi:hypothetical protein